MRACPPRRDDAARCVCCGARTRAMPPYVARVARWKHGRGATCRQKENVLPTREVWQAASACAPSERPQTQLNRWNLYHATESAGAGFNGVTAPPL